MQKNLLFRCWACCMRSALIYIMVLFWATASSAQNVSVTGTVRDAQGALPGVSVSLKNTSVGTITDSKGFFTISATPQDILEFSSVGYLTYNTLVGQQTTLTIVMQPDETALDEVLVNAGYYKVKDKERTGNISKITAKDIENQPVTNVLAAMQGRMAGVNITQTTGVPGGGFEIQIRGQNSIRAAGNNPLYIIDGVPYSSDPIGSGQNSAVLPGRPSPLNSINPDQIESIEVLKDADATSIYGSRGANGVVLITTKSGKSGKIVFNANVSTGMGKVTRFMKLLNTEQYLSMREEALANDGFTELPATAFDVNGTWDRNRYTDWQKELLGGTAMQTDVQTSVSGGSAQTQFLISSAYNRQTTVFPGDFNYRKMNVFATVNHRSESNRFNAQFSTGYTFQNNLQPMTDLTLTALALAPNAPALYTPDGALNFENSTFNNPVASFAGKYESKIYDLIGNGLLSYKILPNLELKSSFGYTSLTNTEITTQPSTMFDPAEGIGPEFSGLIAGNVDRKSWIIEPQLNWRSTMGKMKIDVLAGGTFQWQEGTQLTQFGFGFASNSLISNLASATTINIFSNENNVYKYQAFFGRVNVNWDDTYILNFTGRRDGSSRFGPGKQFANFGAVGAAWLFSNEKFLKGNKVLDFGKLRMSYGITGSDQIGDYQFLDTFGSTGVNYNGIVGLQPTRLYNPSFGWESNKKLEFALELGFLKDRLFFTGSWYRNTSSDQLVGIPLPGSTGFTSLQANLNAVVENKGTEFTLRTVNIKSKDFSWISSFNLTFARNTLLEYPELAGSTFRNTLVIGEPLNIRKVFRFTGVNPETGLYTFEDVDGDGNLTNANDRTVVRDFNPDYYGGLQNEFIYKNFRLDFLFQFVKQINFNEVAFFNPAGTMSNQPTWVLNQWQQPGDVQPHQLYTDGMNSAAFDAYDKYLNSDAAISDASFVRLKNISLSYTLPESISKGLKCRLFIQGQNVLTFTNYRGADPEFKASGYLGSAEKLKDGLLFTFHKCDS